MERGNTDISSGDDRDVVEELQFDEKRSFAEELQEHQTNIVWAFHYGNKVHQKTIEKIEAQNLKYSEEYDSASESPKEFTLMANCEPGTSDDIAIDNFRTPHSRTKTKTKSTKSTNEEREDLDSPKTRNTPLPLLSWADSQEVWQNMVYKEEATLRTRNSRLFEEKNSFLPRMRAILLDWIMEVCEVYRLRRVTYYLAVDYIDRYLTIRPTIPKNQLQLIGISCLFIAAKLEEIYPPRLSEFSYVCDSACSQSEILSCEIVMLNTLGWEINPMTPTGWLNLYMQIHYDVENVKKQKLHDQINFNFIYPQYSGYLFVRASHLIDLFSLDPGFLKFSYSIIAAGAMYYHYGQKVALSVSGLAWDQLETCVEYMSPFYNILRDSLDPKLISMPTAENDTGDTLSYIKIQVPFLISDENHAYQTHLVNLELFEKATILRLSREEVAIYNKSIDFHSASNGNEESNGSPSETDEASSDVSDITYKDYSLNSDDKDNLSEGQDNSTIPTFELSDSDTEYYSKDEYIKNVEFDGFVGKKLRNTAREVKKL